MLKVAVLPLGFMTTRIHLIIRGRVQGVCFRACCVDEARRLGIKGFVRNRPDGSVEAVGEGEEAAIDSFAAWCRRGPPSALVAECEETRGPARGGLDSFSVEY